MGSARSEQVLRIPDRERLNGDVDALEIEDPPVLSEDSSHAWARQLGTIGWACAEGPSAKASGDAGMKLPELERRYSSRGDEATNIPRRRTESGGTDRFPITSHRFTAWHGTTAGA
jgi:hypothetical protein